MRASISGPTGHVTGLYVDPMHTCISFLEAAPDAPSSVSHPENQVGSGMVGSSVAASAVAHDATPAHGIASCASQHMGPHHSRQNDAVKF